jgi:hypothetical protein
LALRHSRARSTASLRHRTVIVAANRTQAPVAFRITREQRSQQLRLHPGQRAVAVSLLKRRADPRSMRSSARSLLGDA